MQVTYWGAVGLASCGNRLCVYHGCPTVDSPHRSLVSGHLEGQQAVGRLASARCLRQSSCCAGTWVLLVSCVAGCYSALLIRTNYQENG